ncbi:bactofilin family protein [Roseobacter sp. EG26]|uniref:bactofilin family protein n=1 Tax=Roseobacter sp. EG26 TaxID=3412477 RepID=UPI002611A17E|nr:polymer-forming cytoskeletal protein [uncultured Roseobacter sp.]
MASSVIEEDLTIEGNIKSDEGSVDVKGKVVGDVTAQSVIVQTGGAINGALSAKSVSIEGKHKGKLQCDDLKLASTSTVQADVTAKTMTSESGARVAGNVQITGN